MNIVKCMFVFLSILPYKLQAEELKIVPLAQLKAYLTYTKIHDPVRLKFTKFPLASSYSSAWGSPVIPETFLIRIPNGAVYSQNGHVIVNKKYLIKELLWPFSFLKKQKNPLDQKDLSNLRHVQGKVVVLAQEGHKNYYHWITEILPKLALLKGTQYDWVYLPRLTQPFQRETLDRMGVDPRKIIEGDENTYIVADELIVPSFVSKSFYTPRWVIDFLQEKLAKPETTLPVFSKKVFISRQKANYRRALNENDVFFLFKPLGFERYNLEDLTFVQQVQLFRDAEIVVAFHGAGLTNIIFCKPNTQIIEIFQARNNNSFCYLSQTSGLRYDFLKTTPFKKEGLYMDTTVPPDLIEGYVKKKFGAQTSLITSLPSKEIKSYN